MYKAAGPDRQERLKQIKKERGFFKQRSNKRQEALLSYGRAVKLDPNFTQAYFGMGDVYLEMHRPKQAGQHNG